MESSGIGIDASLPQPRANGSYAVETDTAVAASDLFLSMEQRVGRVHRPEHVVIVELLRRVQLSVQQNTGAVPGDDPGDVLI